MMSKYHLESAVLFTPGRASYVTTDPEGGFTLNLSQASIHRAVVAEQMFNEDLHTTALYAGGFPGTAQNWPPEHTPPRGGREANLMAKPLKSRLEQAGWSPFEIADRVKEQDESDNSIGDVLLSMQRGYLNPEDFHRKHGIDVVAGRLHGARFRTILSKALGIDPKTVRIADIHDPYGAPATEFRPRESASVAMAKEATAIGLTTLVMAKVRPGVIEDLQVAEQHLKELAAKVAK